MNNADICLCIHTREEHFGGNCSRVNCKCKRFVLIDFAPAILEACEELVSAVRDGLRRHNAGDWAAIRSNMIAATLGQAEAVLRKANS